MLNCELRLCLREAMISKMQEKIDGQLGWIDRGISEVQKYLDGPASTLEAARNVLAYRRELLAQYQRELDRVRGLFVASDEPLSWWLGTNYSLESLWPYMPKVFKDMVHIQHNEDLCRYEIFIDVEGTEISFVVPD